MPKTKKKKIKRWRCKKCGWMNISFSNLLVCSSCHTSKNWEKKFDWREFWKKLIKIGTGNQEELLERILNEIEKEGKQLNNDFIQFPRIPWEQLKEKLKEKLKKDLCQKKK